MSGVNQNNQMVLCVKPFPTLQITNDISPRELNGSFVKKKNKGNNQKISSCPLITVYIERFSLVIVQKKSLVEVTVRTSYQSMTDGRLS